MLGLGVGESEAAGRPGGEVLGLGDRPYLVSVGRVDEHKGSKMLASFFATYKERHPGPLALALVGPVSFELPPHPDIVVTGPVSEADKWDIVRDALVAISPSALESFSLVVIEAWVERVPVLVNGSVRADARELPSDPGEGCGSPPTPSSRRRCSACWPMPPCAPHSVPGAASTWTATSAGRSSSPATTGSSPRWSSAAAASPGCSEPYCGRRPTTVYIGCSMASVAMSCERWWRWAWYVISVRPNPSRLSMETTAPG